MNLLVLMHSMFARLEHDLVVRSVHPQNASHRGGNPCLDLVPWTCRKGSNVRSGRCLCLAAARESCLQLAKEKCLPAFRDARIALSDWDRLGKLQRPTISSTSSPKGAESKSEMLRQLSLGHSSECYPQATNYKGHVLLEGTISLGTSEDESSSGLVSDRT